MNSSDSNTEYSVTTNTVENENSVTYIRRVVNEISLTSTKVHYSLIGRKKKKNEVIYHLLLNQGDPEGNEFYEW